LFPYSIDKAELAQTKLAHISAEKRVAINSRLNQIGQTFGINFSWGGKIGPTRDAHRLIHLTQTKKNAELQDHLVMALFRAYHEEEKDINDRTVLTELADQAGLDKEEVESYLLNDKSGMEVDAEEKQWKPKTSSGVPFFIIQNEFNVEGAQDAMDYFEIFTKIKETTG
jgi:predicted DsbA family dithiol-disulfide isomerase